jgi:lipoate-protein ligase A
MTDTLRVIDAGYAPALRTQALWYAVARRMQADAPPALTLVNPDEPFVCIGLHQDARLEVDEDFCRRQGIAVLRRRLGGGAVYIDRNQLIFHFIWPRRRAPGRAARLYPLFIEPVVRAYRALGIAAVYRPLNDIHVGGRKIGGTAAGVFEEATVLGGMFLFDFDAAAMARCLRVPTEKFRDKLQATLADYVTTMRRLLPAVPSRAAVKELFLAQVAECLQVTPEAAAPSPAEVDAIAEETAALSDPGWLYAAGRRLVPKGVKIAADLHLTEGTHKAPGGLIRVRLLERDGRIADLDITGDFTCLPADGLAALAARLRGAALVSEELTQTIGDAVDALGLDLPGVAPDDLGAAIMGCRESW